MTLVLLATAFALFNVVLSGIVIARKARRHGLPNEDRQSAVVGAIVVHSVFGALFVSSSHAMWAPRTGVSSTIDQALALSGLVIVGLWVLSGRGVPFMAALHRAGSGREASVGQIRFLYGYVFAVGGALAPLVWRLLDRLGS